MIEQLENRMFLSSTLPTIDAATPEASPPETLEIWDETTPIAENADVIVASDAGVDDPSIGPGKDQERVDPVSPDDLLLGDMMPDEEALPVPEYREEWVSFDLETPFAATDRSVFRDDNSHVKVEIVKDWSMGGSYTAFGEVSRINNDLSVKLTGKSWTGPCTCALETELNTLDLGQLEDGDYSLTIVSGTNILAVLKFTVEPGWSGQRIDPQRYSPQICFPILPQPQLAPPHNPFADTGEVAGGGSDDPTGSEAANARNQDIVDFVDQGDEAEDDIESPA